ncbi:MAG: preprotein translocase subunit YajC [Ghiorsea sp.]
MNTSTLNFSISKAVVAMSVALLPANVAFAEDQAGGGIMSLIPLVLIMVIFWVLLIRPQQKKMKEHAAKVSAIKRGNKIITGGGILGRVSNVKDGIVTVEVAEGVEIKVKQDTITDLQESPVPKEKQDKKES